MVNFFEKLCSKIKKGRQYIIEAGIYIVWIVGIVVGGVHCVNNENMAKYIFVLSNNICSTNSTFELKDMVNVYPVLSSSSYIATEQTPKEQNKEMENKTIAQDTQIIDFNITAVDAFSTDINQIPNTAIYEAAAYQKVKTYGITIQNYSSNRKINFEKYFSNNNRLNISNPSVYLYCTHTSESYINSEGYSFAYSGTMRTRDAKYNMLSVASILSQSLKIKGIDCTFDTTPHDYTSYENAYKNSRQTLTKALNTSGGYSLAIDVHRDAYGDLYSSPTVKINKKDVALIMIVVGIGTDGYKNPYWETNLSYALQIMKRGEEMYPGLFRPLLIRDSKYNQDINKGSILIEVGATGNTHEQVYYAARCFANILEQVF